MCQFQSYYQSITCGSFCVKSTKQTEIINKKKQRKPENPYSNMMKPIRVILNPTENNWSKHRSRQRVPSLPRSFLYMFKRSHLGGAQEASWSDTQTTSADSFWCVGVAPPMLLALSPGLSMNTLHSKLISATCICHFILLVNTQSSRQTVGWG